MIANYGLTPAQLELAAVTPANYPDDVRFHSAFNFLTITGGFTPSAIPSFPAFNRDNNTFSQGGGGICGCSSTTVTVPIPTMEVQTVLLGSNPNTGVTPTLLFVKLDGSKFSAQGHTFSGTGWERFFFPVYQSSDDTIRLSCIAFCSSANMPAKSFTSMEVKVGG
jgi:hypothetical protein|tara:strand:+ start:600 stop:1094 length:495 start_codon:yes stop_codon:yes gene_type:complete